MDKYQRYTKEWNQVERIRLVKAKTFKESREVLDTSSSTITRWFKEVAENEMVSRVYLPKITAIDEYKGDTDAGTFQLIIANAVTHEPIDILPNHRKNTIKDYLFQYESEVEMFVMDMNPSFKEAVKQALGRPEIIAGRFHFCRYIYWAIDEARRKVQKNGMCMTDRNVNG